MPVQDDLQHSEDLDPTPDKVTSIPPEAVTLNNVAGRTIRLVKTQDGYEVNPDDQDVADEVGLNAEFPDERVGIMTNRALSRKVKLEGLQGQALVYYIAALAQDETNANG